MRRTFGILSLLVLVSIIPLIDHGESAPPVVTINEPEEGEFLPAGNVTMNWSTQLNQTELDHFEIRINDGNWTDIGVNSSIEIDNTITGNNTVSVRAYDNESFGEANVTFFIDDIAPLIEIISPLNGSLINTSAVNLTWKIIEEASGLEMIRIRVDEGPWVYANNSEFMIFQNISEGAHTIIIEAVDNVGNLGTASTAFSLDSTPPSVLDVGPLGMSVEREEIIFINIGEKIDTSSAEFNMIPTIEGNLTITDLSIVFVPNGTLMPGFTYSVSVNFSDHAGNRVGPYEWSFSVADHYLMGKVSGYVVDSYGEYVQGAMVTIGNVTVFTNTFGNFELEVMPGDYYMIIKKENYTTYEGLVTLLPTQELDIGKTELKGGPPRGEGDEEEFPWLPIFIGFLVIVVLAIFFITYRNRKASMDRGIEE